MSERSPHSRKFGTTFPTALGVISVIALAGCSSAADDAGAGCAIPGASIRRPTATTPARTECWTFPPDQTWAGTIDLRIIDPGDACGSGMTAPYLPLTGDIGTKSIHISEPHAH